MQNISPALSPADRRRKFLVIFPLLTLPFLIVLLWVVGLVGTPGSSTPIEAAQGFNATLPGARPSADSAWNKLQFYEQADEDSARYRSQLKSDPYYNLAEMDESAGSEVDTLLLGFNRKNNDVPATRSYDPYPSELAGRRDANEEKVYRKLAALNRALEKPHVKEPIVQAERPESPVPSMSPDVERLERMMQLVQTGDAGGDPEMNRIDGMLDKILDIQHPERINNELQAKSAVNTKQVFPVVSPSASLPVSMLGKTADTIFAPGRFYSFEEPDGEAGSSAAIPATISADQTLVNGSTVKLELKTDVFISGIQIPRSEFVFGKASLVGDRVRIQIKSIQYQNHVLPVDLSVYNLDGMEGLYAPGSISRDAGKQSADQAIQGMNIGTLDPSIGAQAASAGIQAAKSLIGKKAKLTRIYVRAGYEVLLVDNNVKQP